MSGNRAALRSNRWRAARLLACRSSAPRITFRCCSRDGVHAGRTGTSWTISCRPNGEYAEA
eukprot:2817080-Alexandrium_andersonii.AAC.1